MKLRLRALFAGAISLLLASCNGQDSQYYRVGIGTELPYGKSDVDEQTHLQSMYLAQLCKQAGVVYVESVDMQPCSGMWPLIVQAGLNDIDNRCDSYLSWLDSKRRDAPSILQQIGDVQTATSAVLLATGVGVDAVGIVAAAFGLSRSTFANYNSRLIQQIDQSTVQTVVLSSQTRLRKEIAGLNITDRPMAVYALRQYLRLCAPFTIETEINITVATYSSGGAAALQARSPLVGTFAMQPSTPQAKVGRVFAPVPQDAVLSQYFNAAKNSGLSNADLKQALMSICVPENRIVDKSPSINAKIMIYQDYWNNNKPTSAKTIVVDGKLKEEEVSTITQNEKICGSTFENFFEFKTFPNGLNYDPTLVGMLNKKLPLDSQLTRGDNISKFRSAIKSIKSELYKSDPNNADKLISNYVSDQMTSYFYNKLKN